MALDSEPQPGAGSMPRAATILGSDPLKRALDDNTTAAKNETAAIQALLAKMGYGGGGGRPSSDRENWLGQSAAQRGMRQASASSVAGWNPGTIGGQPVTGSQGAYKSGRTTPGPLSPAPAVTLPSQYSGASASMATAQAYNQWQNKPSTRQQANQSPASPPYSYFQTMAQQQPYTPSSGAGPAPTFGSPAGPPNNYRNWPANGMAARNGGGGQFNLPGYGGGGGMRPPAGWQQGNPLGGAGGGGAAVNGGAQGGAAGAGGIKSFISQNKTQLGVGLAAGAMTAAGNAIDSYSTRMLNTNYDQFGNLVVLRNGGYSGKTYGNASSQGIDKLRSSRFVATSPADLINGGSQILANSNNQTFGQNLTNAGVSAYLSPGMGIGQTATNQQQEGTNKANVISQMMFGIGTRTPGGGQTSETDIANAALNMTRGGQGMTGMTPDKLAAMLQQGGSLRTNLNTYASNAGLGPEAVDSLANILQAQTAYQNKYGSTTDFQSTVSAASQGDKAATAKLKGTGIGESVEQSVLNRQGTQINRDMNSQATYIDTLKKTNQVMQQLSDTLTAFMKNTGLDKALGFTGGANAGSGGRVGSTLKSAAVGAALGSFIGPEGTVLGGALGGAYGFITGGAEDPVKRGSAATQNAAPAATSGAATSAASFAVGQVGKPYVSGATGPNAYDCSGLMMTAYKQAGVSIPRVSSTQSQFGVAVPPDQIGPGDLIFPRGYDGMNGAPAGLPGHVVMALSGGPNIQVVEAGSPQTGVYTTTMSIGDVESARRVTGGVGTLAPNLNVSATGASNTNTATTAGKAQASGSGGSRGMNEIDVLGSVLGSSGFQSPATLAGSAQKTGQLSVNGTANKNPSYSKGAYAIDGDQLANLHDGETVLDSKLSRSMRAALMADIPNHMSPGSGGASVTFASGAISISVAGAMTAGSATSAAKQVADAIAADDRIQRIGRGL